MYLRRAQNTEHTFHAHTISCIVHVRSTQQANNILSMYILLVLLRTSKLALIIYVLNSQMLIRANKKNERRHVNI